MQLKKILLIHGSGRIGDSLLAIPAISSIGAGLKSYSIDLLAHKNRLDLFYNIPNINLIGSISEKRAPLSGWFISKKYDYVIVFNYGENQENIVKYALRVGLKVIASSTNNLNLDLKLFRKIPKKLKRQHMVLSYLSYLSEFNLKDLNLRIKIYLTKQEIVFAENTIKSINNSEDKFFVGFQLASFPTRSYRDWPIEHFVELAKKIMLQVPKSYFLIFGGNEEREKINRFKMQMSTNNYMDFSGLSLRKTAALMSMINLYVGVDTGPTHMMSGFDIPSLALYHGKFPSYLYAPVGHPCFISLDHPLGNLCSELDTMKDIGVKQVFNSIKPFLVN